MASNFANPKQKSIYTKNEFVGKKKKKKKVILFLHLSNLTNTIILLGDNKNSSTFAVDT